MEVGSLYRFFVVSHNQKGSSLPSSIIKLNVSAAAWQGIPISGASSPPHILSLDARSPTWLKFSWNPPAISHPEDLLKYRWIEMAMPVKVVRCFFSDFTMKTLLFPTPS